MLHECHTAGAIWPGVLYHWSDGNVEVCVDCPATCQKTRLSVHVSRAMCAIWQSAPDCCTYSDNSKVGFWMLLATYCIQCVESCFNVLQCYCEISVGPKKKEQWHGCRTAQADAVQCQKGDLVICKEILRQQPTCRFCFLLSHPFLPSLRCQILESTFNVQSQWSSCQDAHEFLSLVLDQLKEELIQLAKEVPEPLSPVRRGDGDVRHLQERGLLNPTQYNFEMEVEHTFKCQM